MITLQELKSYLECDDDFILELTQQFRTESQVCLAEIKEAMTHENAVKIASSAHRMMSSTRIFKFDGLTEILSKLEDQNVWDRMRHADLISALQSSLNVSLEELSALEAELTKSD